MTSDTAPAEQQQSCPEQTRGRRAKYRLILMVLGIMNLVDCVNSNILTPYVEDLMSSLLHKPRGDADLDFAVSFIIGWYAVCEFLFSYMWGALADRIGRKPTLLIGIAGSAVAPILMGFATTFEQAFIARTMDGFFCGNGGVTKAYLGEVIDPSEEARGFSFLALCNSMGLILGPLLGGHLVRPAETMPGIFANTIFDKFPFLLANASYALLAVFALVVGAYALEETLPASKRKSVIPCPRRHEPQNLSGSEGGTHPNRLAPPLLQSVEVDSAGSEASSSNAASLSITEGSTSRVLVQSTETTSQSRGSDPALCSLLPLRWSCITLCLIGGYIVARQQLFSIFTSSSQEQMGFNFSAHEIGSMQLFAALGLLTTQLLIYPRFCKRFGFFTAFKVGALANTLVTLPYPLFALLADGKKFGYWRYVPLALWQGVGQAGCGFMFPTTFVWVNRSAHSSIKGRANGMVNALAALSRGAWPLLVAGALQLLSRPNFPVLLRFTVLVQNGALLLLAVFASHKLPHEFSGLKAHRPPSESTAPSSSSVAAA